MALSQEQIDRFTADGYLSLGKVLEDAEIEVLRREYDREFEKAEADGRFRDLATNPDDDQVDKGGAGKRMLQIMQMCERNIHFRQLLFKQELLDHVADLIGPNIMLFHDQALYKPARHGGAVYWHQDNAYWQCHPANLVSCWITLDDVDIENGAMQMIPGSHLRPASHERANPALLETEVDESQATVVELPAGGAMIHHCQTLHHTQPNQTDRQRRAFAIHYMPVGTKDKNGETMHAGWGHPILHMSL